MTDKYIINGLDVSKCIFSSRGITHNLCKEPQEVDEECKYNPNCYYKQLKRKEQEYQRLVNKNNRLEEQLNTIKLLLEGKNNQYAAKEQEYKRLKYDNDYQVAVLETTIDNLKVELEQEKTLKEMYFTYYKAKHSDIKGEFFKLKAENENLKQALTEIKEIARWHTTSADSEDIQDDMKQILQLIKEINIGN